MYAEGYILLISSLTSIFRIHFDFVNHNEFVVANVQCHADLLWILFDITWAVIIPNLWAFIKVLLYPIMTLDEKFSYHTVVFNEVHLFSRYVCET